MNAPRLPLLFLLCSWAASCGGSEFTATPGGEPPDAAAGGADAGTDAPGGHSGTPGVGGKAGGAPTGGAGGSSGAAGAAGTGGIGGAAGAAGATGGTAGTSGKAGAGGESGSSGAAGSAGSGATCPAGQECFANLPPGWTVVATGISQPPGCALNLHTLYSQSNLDAANGYTCPCDCDAPATETCTTTLRFTDAACVSFSSSACTVGTSCTHCTANPSNASHLRVESTLNATCATPAPGTPASVAKSGFVCDAYASNPPATCKSAGVCIKSFAAPAKVCILHTGEQACPAGYSPPASYFETIADTRSCAGTCSCKPMCQCAGQDCQVKIHADLGCTSAASVVKAGPCAQKPAEFGAEFGAVLASQAQGSCQPQLSSPLTGAVTGAAQVTICCPL